MDFYMEKRGQHWHENRQQPLKHIRRRVAKAKKNDTLEIFRAANNFKTIMDIMFGNKCRKKPKKNICSQMANGIEWTEHAWTTAQPTNELTTKNGEVRTEQFNVRFD